MNQRSTLSAGPVSRAMAQWAGLSAVALSLLLPLNSRAGETRIVSPKPEQVVGNKFELQWTPKVSRTIVIHRENTPEPIIKKYDQSPGTAYTINEPGLYIVKVWREGDPLPEAEVWVTVQATTSTGNVNKQLRVLSPIDGATVNDRIVLRWESPNQPLTVAFYERDRLTIKLLNLRSGQECVVSPETTQATFWVEGEARPCAIVRFTVSQTGQ